jgi:hypothetical protein
LSENEYVATAAAEKRLREVLAARFDSETRAESVAVALLDGARIEYKARAKQVTITLDLPDKAATKAPTEPVAVETADPNPGFSPDDAADTAGKPLPPTPRIAAFAPVLDPDAEYEDIHFD